mgnify:CR=1 FL=1
MKIIGRLIFFIFRSKLDEKYYNSLDFVNDYVNQTKTNFETFYLKFENDFQTYHDILINLPIREYSNDLISSFKNLKQSFIMNLKVISNQNQKQAKSILNQFVLF